MRVNTLKPVFVHDAPNMLEPGTLYVSMPFRTSVHLCCCGCGGDVWLPIRPDRYTVTYDGEHVSFSPSVGNWRFPCRSHYWIRANKVIWHVDDEIDTDATRLRWSWWRLLLNWLGVRRSSRYVYHRTPSRLCRTLSRSLERCDFPTRTYHRPERALRERRSGIAARSPSFRTALERRSG